MKVEGLADNELLLRRAEIVRREGAHTKCSIQYIARQIHPQKLRSLLQGMRRSIGTDVDVLGGDMDHTRLLRGTITSIEYEVTYTRAMLVITVESFSRKADLANKRFCRIYQDTEKTFGSVAAAVHPNEVDVEIADAALDSCPIPGIVVQNDETDFQFLCRLTHSAGRPVFVDDTSSRPALVIGARDWGAQAIEEKDIREVSGSLNEDCVTIELRTDKPLQLGGVAQLEGEQYIVYGERILFENNEYTYRYGLRAQKPSAVEAWMLETEFACAGAARVANNEDPEHLGRLQLEFLQDSGPSTLDCRGYEDRLPGQRAWAPYLPVLTEACDGVAMFPDPGEVVHVIVEKGVCMVDGCLRRKALASAIEDPRIRGAVLRGQTWLLHDEQLDSDMFGTKLTIHQEKVQIDRESTSMGINDDGLTVLVDKTHLILAPDKAVAEAASVKVQASGEVAADARTVTTSASDKTVTKTKTAQIEASDVRVSAQGAVRIATRSFDVG